MARRRQHLAVVVACGTRVHRACAQTPDNIVFAEAGVAITRGRYGLAVTKTDDAVVGAHLRELGEWEQAILDATAEFVRPGDWVWEGGAHIGAHTREPESYDRPCSRNAWLDKVAPIVDRRLGLAAQVGEKGGVHAWEPQPEARGLLSAAVALNGLTGRVHVHADALGDVSDDGTRVAARACRDDDDDPPGPSSRRRRRPTACAKVDAAYDRNSGLFSLVDTVAARRLPREGSGRASEPSVSGPRDTDDDDDDDDVETVAVASLDSLRDRGEIHGPCPRLIKTDVEGMDYRLLAGAARVIDACRPHLLFEAMAPRRTWPRVVDTVLAPHPSYRCAWLVFRITPSRRGAFRSGRSPGALKADARTGPMSFNALCASDISPLDLAPTAAKRGDLLPATDGRVDVLYGHADCAEYEALLKAQGVFEWVTGIPADLDLEAPSSPQTVIARPTICATTATAS